MSLRSAITIGGEVVAGKTKAKSSSIPRRSIIDRTAAEKATTHNFVILIESLSV